MEVRGVEPFDYYTALTILCRRMFILRDKIDNGRLLIITQCRNGMGYKVGFGVPSTDVDCAQNSLDMHVKLNVSGQVARVIPLIIFL